ncbi:LysR substrate-binding domain-containing protein [Brochothrix thermosphacta]|uniref:LysR family transcriptional regulator n=1 Tax=Brochothrix thermosphacta TaxID=2756 RepID=A0A1D2LNS2_BROTH|nr:LysR substrate-binding domain-containing protein [Brochothrix thermosphacta]ANZ96378.1 LysR family transcriptional regulator [Brochothrix thermosphacta]ATF25796.1 LysR family transcriptional regulator [Brochothrix thermosphacta]ATH85132.1 LysR family transcriptional regulator [Brochothrix thermosphacta]MPQ28504.1 LysR family transcriptional regulator [Brochothrix thermosphacta]ODJ65002.1 LysR family transcriptional regulator [Brochothrix thermosphacta]
MELRHLHYFLTLCEELHFSEAAFKIGISQPTLSQQIRVLEGEVGVPLFDRLGKKTVQTEAGLILQRYAIKAIKELENAQTAIDDLKDAYSGTLRVAVLPSDLDYHLTELLVAFHRDFPSVHIEVIPSIDIPNKVLLNEVDIGLALVEPAHSQLTARPIFKESYCLFVSKKSHLATRKKIEISELVDIPLILYPKGFYGRDLIDRWCLTQGIRVEPIMAPGSSTAIFQLIEAGVGASIQPHKLIEAFEDKDMIAIPIEDAPQRSLAIIYRNDRYLSKAAQRFITELTDYFQKQ